MTVPPKSLWISLNNFIAPGCRPRYRHTMGAFDHERIRVGRGRAIEDAGQRRVTRLRPAAARLTARGGPRRRQGRGGRVGHRHGDRIGRGGPARRRRRRPSPDGVEVVLVHDREQSRGRSWRRRFRRDFPRHASFNENGGKVFPEPNGTLRSVRASRSRTTISPAASAVAAQDQGEAGVVAIGDVELFDQFAVVVLAKTGTSRRAQRPMSGTRPRGPPRRARSPDAGARRGLLAFERVEHHQEAFEPRPKPTAGTSGPAERLSPRPS